MRRGMVVTEPLPDLVATPPLTSPLTLSWQLARLPDRQLGPLLFQFLESRVDPESDSLLRSLR